MQKLNTKRNKLSLVIAAASIGLGTNGLSFAQEEDGIDIPPPMEEVTITGRLRTSADAILQERQEQPFAADILSFDQIVKIGDPDVASALRRVTGLTLIGGKYIYVRGLGERYSSTSLNGAEVPSPELTRNVIPLDLLPSSIVESIKVQKAYSADLPAAFGGGNINIRTKSIPEGPLFSISIGTGINSESSDDGIFYSGGNEAGLPSAIASAIQSYEGDIGTNSILSFIDEDGGTTTPEQRAQAAQINRDLMLSLDRDIAITPKSLDNDLNGSISAGYSWDMPKNFTFGVLGNYSTSTKWRNKNQTRQGIGNPENNYSDSQITVEETHDTASLNLGLNYTDDHNIKTNSYFIENTDDRAQVTVGVDSNISIGEEERVEYITRFEKRELTVNQILGEHRIALPFVDGVDLEIDWFYSDSTAKTDIPNTSNVSARNTLDTSGNVVATNLLSTTSVATFSFLELEDEVESSGWSASLPLEFDSSTLELSGGFENSRKSRQYYGYTANINASGVRAEYLLGTPGQVLTDANLSNPDAGFNTTLGTGLGNESYIAAQMIDGVWGSFDWILNDTWRVTGGARWEDFRRVVVPLDLLDFSGESIIELGEELQSDDQSIAVLEDDVYPSLAFTYMTGDFLGAEEFQLRFSYANTAVRPDLREVSDVQYIDPELEVRVVGNPGLQNAELDHFDIRGEWYYDNGDSLTASLFYKDITDPIEQNRTPGSDDDILLGFFNGVSGEVTGVEFEGLKELGYGLFLSGNVTLSESEIISPEGEGYENLTRSMTGHSEVVTNLQLNFDSEDEKHSVSLAYNMFSERVFYASRSNGHDDAFEQPFNSLDFVYSFYPTESFTVNLKLENLLDEKHVYEQVNSSGTNVTILEQDVGTSVGLKLSYSF